MHRYSSQAEKNRKRLEVQGITAVSLSGVNGAGRTSILKETLECLGSELRIGVIAGGHCNDLAAVRITRGRIPVVQVEEAVSLDAVAVGEALERLPLNNLDLLFIDLPAAPGGPACMDAGEDLRVFVCGVDGGSDGPLQQQHSLCRSQVMLLNKIDMLHKTGFESRSFKRRLFSLNPGIRLFPVSARTGVGMGDWCRWLKRFVNGKKPASQEEATA